MNKIMTHVIVKFWFESKSAADMPFNVIQLYKDLLDYKRFDKEMADNVIKCLERHLRNCSEENVVLALASDKVEERERERVYTCIFSMTQEFPLGTFFILRESA